MANHHDSHQASTNYKEAFALFDKRGNQRVALESLGDLLRACGQNPTLAEIRELEKNAGSDCELNPEPPIPEARLRRSCEEQDAEREHKLHRRKESTGPV